MRYLGILLFMFGLSVLLQDSKSSKHLLVHPAKRNNVRRHNISANGKKAFKQVRATGVKHHSHDSSAACIIRSDSKGVLSFQGGAVIISDIWAITGAQVMLGFSGIKHLRKTAYVFANANDGVHPYDGMYQITKYYVHPDFKFSLDYDIAAIKVKDMFIFNGLSFTIMSSQTKFETGWLANLAEWRISPAGHISKVYAKIHQAEIKLIDVDACRKIYKSIDGLVTDRMLCAYSNISDTCASGAGSALYLEDELIGLVSWGAPGRCGNSIYPDVYTKISELREWIINIVSTKTYD